MTASKDLNFCFPVRELSNERVKMTPFEASIHSSPFVSAVSALPELWAHMPTGPFQTVQDFDTNFLEAVVHRDPGMVLFAIIDKTKPPSAVDGEGELAGMMSYTGSSSVNLGLRRVQWQCSSMNAPSIRAAERLGFEKEGIMKWHRVFHGGKERGKVHSGRELSRGGLGEQDYGRDTVVLSHCWDDWEQGGREKIQAIMDRQH